MDKVNQLNVPCNIGTYLYLKISCYLSEIEHLMFSFARCNKLIPRQETVELLVGSK